MIYWWQLELLQNCFMLCVGSSWSSNRQTLDVKRLVLSLTVFITYILEIGMLNKQLQQHHIAPRAAAFSEASNSYITVYHKYIFLSICY